MGASHLFAGLLLIVIVIAYSVPLVRFPLCSRSLELPLINATHIGGLWGSDCDYDCEGKGFDATANI